jgi:hypothetical protein
VNCSKLPRSAYFNQFSLLRRPDRFFRVAQIRSDNRLLFASDVDVFYHHHYSEEHDQNHSHGHNFLLLLMEPL